MPALDLQRISLRLVDLAAVTGLGEDWAVLDAAQGVNELIPVSPAAEVIAVESDINPQPASGGEYNFEWAHFQVVFYAALADERARAEEVILELTRRFINVLTLPFAVPPLAELPEGVTEPERTALLALRNLEDCDLVLPDRLRFGLTGRGGIAYRSGGVDVFAGIPPRSL